MSIVEEVIQGVVDNWYWFVIIALGGTIIYYWLQNKDNQKGWAVRFKPIFRADIVNNERLNKSTLKYIYKGHKAIGKIITYSEHKSVIQLHNKDKTKGIVTFGTIVFTHIGKKDIMSQARQLMGVGSHKSIMRFMKLEDEYPDITSRDIIFSESQTFKEKDGFYIPLGDDDGYEFVMNSIAEDIQKFDKDRSLDINASSMQKLAGLPPDWAHQEKMKEMDMEMFKNYKKNMGWKAG